MLKTFILIFLVISTARGEISVEFKKLEIENEKAWEISFALYNHSDESVIVNTGYMQHGIDFSDRISPSFQLVTDNAGAVVNGLSYIEVPPIGLLKQVTLKKHQYTIVEYKFEPDEDDVEFLKQLKNGVKYKLEYSSKDRGFAYSYWTGKIKSENSIVLTK